MKELTMHIGYSGCQIYEVTDFANSQILQMFAKVGKVATVMFLIVVCYLTFSRLMLVTDLGVIYSIAAAVVINVLLPYILFEIYLYSKFRAYKKRNCLFINSNTDIFIIEQRELFKELEILALQDLFAKHRAYRDAQVEVRSNIRVNHFKIRNEC
jgi:hypothetical protein